MKTYILELPVSQTNEIADSAWEAADINDHTFVDIKELTQRLSQRNIDRFYTFTIPNFISHVNNGNDNFENSYLASINIVN